MNIFKRFFKRRYKQPTCLISARKTVTDPYRLCYSDEQIESDLKVQIFNELLKAKLITFTKLENKEGHYTNYFGSIEVVMNEEMFKEEQIQ